jgi:[ribosomal protein S18]-alanine N-acetyltransferase
MTANSLVFRIMEISDLEKIIVIENVCHKHPWSKKNFIDCLEHGYWNYVLLDSREPEPLVGYCIVMPGVEELHLLNISIAPNFQRRQIAQQALLAIEKTGFENGYKRILLEVRKSNIPAINLYKKLNYQLIGQRKDYYPVISQTVSREDALVMEKGFN